MIIINADDWGASRDATDAAFECFKAGRLASVTAMVFMRDAERAAEIARDTALDVGLHINLDEPFADGRCLQEVVAAHARIGRFLRWHKYAQVLYNPWLRSDFRRVYEAQVTEFQRLYGRAPSHFDGHHHLHLCSNMMMDNVIPRGQIVRRSFSFSPGQKSWVNRCYRHYVDFQLGQRFRLTDYFFALSRYLEPRQFETIAALARMGTVELMTHPERRAEFDWLMSDNYLKSTLGLQVGSFTALATCPGSAGRG
jgi:predicted glycoside hydrolase/deacetylase ChbG (UPF0249 family)